MLTNEEQKQKLSESIETIQEKKYTGTPKQKTLQRERISEQNILLEEHAILKTLCYMLKEFKVHFSCQLEK